MKFKTKSEYYKHQIEKVNSIVIEYERREKEDEINEIDLAELIKRKNFITRLNKDNEEIYLRYVINDEPYYDQYTYEYYKDVFSKLNLEKMDFQIICEINSFINNEDIKPSQKVKNVKNMFKAYKEISKINLL